MHSPMTRTGTSNRRNEEALLASPHFDEDTISWLKGCKWKTNNNELLTCVVIQSRSPQGIVVSLVEQSGRKY